MPSPCAKSVALSLSLRSLHPELLLRRAGVGEGPRVRAGSLVNTVLFCPVAMYDVPTVELIMASWSLCPDAMYDAPTVELIMASWSLSPDAMYGVPTVELIMASWSLCPDAMYGVTTVELIMASWSLSPDAMYGVPTVELTSLAGLMSSFLLHLSVDELNPGGVL